MVTAIILLILTLIALLVFIGLYVDETRRVQETYRKQYKTELKHVSEEITYYMEPEGDHELVYQRVSSYMSCAASFAFLIDDFSEQQKAVNEINTCLIKYPEQMAPKMEELKTAVDDILADLDKGYDELEAIIETIDLKGN
ncbi:MAG: hypothetical protein IJ737_05335 [Ruminococcus sp.]|nr:hypothetical protein [Ruminococcus sp.]